MSRVGQIAGSVAVAVIAAGALLIPSFAGPAALPIEAADLGPSDVQVVPAQVVLSCPVPVSQALIDESSVATSQTPSAVTQSFALTELRAGALTTAVPSESRGQDAASAAARATLTGRDPIAVLAGAAAPAWATATTILGSVPDAEPGDTGARPAGTLAQWAAQGDQRGLTAGMCLTPGPEQWIVAGNTEPGNTSNLVINNPGLTTVTATVTVYGAIEAADGEYTDIVAVAPGTTQVVPLGALIPAESRIVAHVVTDGGYVTAAIVQNSLAGLVPIGVDLAASGDGPATVQVLPGVATDGSAIGDERGAILRLLAPESAANASVRLVTATGVQPLRGAQEVALERGRVTDISLGDVPAGTYTIVVTADAPIVAGAKGVQRGGTITSTEGSLSVDVGTSGDFTWVQSRRADLGDSRVVVPIPSGLLGKLVLVRSADQPAALAAELAELPIVGDSEAAAAATGSGAQATLTAYDANGAPVASQEVEIGPNLPVTVDLATLGAAGTVAAIAVDLPVTTGERFDVALLATIGEVEGSLAVLQPVANSLEPVTIPVVRGPLG